MCSIIGFKARTTANHQDKVEEYLKILEERGDQSFGYFYITPDGKLYYAKSLSLVPLLKDIKEIPKDSWCFLHARKASAGMAGATVTEKIARAHPVESDDESILLLHNGTKASIKDTVQGSISDSQGLATLLSLMWDSRELLAQEIGVVIYERKGKIYLYKDGMRPLVMDEDGTIFASEPIDDQVKWRDIAHTTGTIAKPSFDIELDFKKDFLGLTVSKPVEIEFKPYEYSVKNFSIAGMPTVSQCLTCKKKHIENKETFRRCCTCVIEGRKETVYGHNVTTKNTYQKPAKTIETKAKKPATVVGGDVESAVVPAKQNTTKVNKGGIIERSSEAMPSPSQVEVFTSDVNILKALGYDNVIWKGWATIKANIIYKSTNGALFAIPNENSSTTVKVDRVFIEKDSPLYKHEYSTVSYKTIPMIGKINNSNVYAIKHNIDLSQGVRNVASGEYKLETCVMPNGLNGSPDAAKSVLVGFKSLENK